MQLGLKFLPPWYPIESGEVEAGLASWIRKYLPTNETLLDLSFTVIGACRARDEIVVRLQDGRFARIILPDRPWALPSIDDSLEIAYFDDVGGLNAFILRDAADHQ